MTVVLRTPTAVIETFASETVSELAIVTDSYVITRFSDLALVHAGPCRVRIRTSKVLHDYFSENLFSYNSDSNTLFVFIEQHYRPFDEAMKQLPAKNRRKLLKLTDGMTVDELVRLNGKYGTINLVNAIKQTAWQQTMEISGRYRPKEK